MKKLFILNFRRVILAIVLMCSFIKAHSQIQRDFEKKINLDSLVKINENYTKQDEIKLRMLNDLAKGYYNQKIYDKAIIKVDEAIALALLLKKPWEEATALHYKATLIEAKGNPKQAITIYEQALVINKSLNNAYGICRNMMSMGFCNLRLSEYIIARSNYEQSLSISEEKDFKKEKVECITNIGKTYMHLSENAKALEYFNRSLKMSELLEDKKLMLDALNMIGMNYFSMSDYRKSLSYYLKSAAIEERLNNGKTNPNTLGNIGRVYLSLSDYKKAIEYFEKTVFEFEKIGVKGGLAAGLGNLGIAYDKLSNQTKAIEYYKKALELNEQLANKNGMANNFMNIGNTYNSIFEYQKAIEYYQKALTIYNQLGIKSGQSSIKANLGILIRDAPDSILIVMKIIPSERYSIAEKNLIDAFEMSKEINLISGQSTSLKALSKLYEIQGNYTKAFEFYKNHIILRDSIEGENIKNQITRKEVQFEFAKKEDSLNFVQKLTNEQLAKQQILNIQQSQLLTLRSQELQLTSKEKELQHLAFLKEQAEKQEKTQKLSLVEKEKALQESQIQSLNKEKYLQEATIRTKNQQRNGFIAGSILLFLLAGAIFMGLRRTAKEKKVSETLLLNILPAEVAQELKAKGEAEAKLIDDATVLFTDFKGFTGLSEILTPKELVSDLNHCFSAFDKITQKYGIEKIKTIGDAYMAAGGLPSPNKTHAKDVVLAAIEIKEFMDKGKLEKIAKNQPFFEIRIGVNTGPVVAGIVGVKKFQYDIWGDTVNTASRMESSGEIGKVNISQSTYELLKNDSELDFEHRGKVSAKGKGEVDMYFVKLRS